MVGGLTLAVREERPCPSYNVEIPGALSPCAWISTICGLPDFLSHPPICLFLILPDYSSEDTGHNYHITLFIKWLPMDSVLSISILKFYLIVWSSLSYLKNFPRLLAADSQVPPSSSHVFVHADPLSWNSLPSSF